MRGLRESPTSLRANQYSGGPLLWCSGGSRGKLEGWGWVEKKGCDGGSSVGSCGWGSWCNLVNGRFFVFIFLFPICY